eukprot:COSAG01_NODE_1801_length_9200_cov_13.641358_12_plen_112_part_00
MRRAAAAEALWLDAEPWPSSAASASGCCAAAAAAVGSYARGSTSSATGSSAMSCRAGSPAPTKQNGGLMPYARDRAGPPRRHTAAQRVRRNAKGVPRGRPPRSTDKHAPLN